MVDGGSYNGDKAYKDSKLCNVLFTLEASRRLKDLGIGVNAFSPGLNADPNGFFKYQNPLFARIFDLITRVLGFKASDEFNGSCLAFLAADALVDSTTGLWFDWAPPGKNQLMVVQPSPEAGDAQKQQMLWEISARLTQAPHKY